MITEQKLFAQFEERCAWLTTYALEQMTKHGLAKEGWTFEIASFYQEELRRDAGLPAAIGLCAMAGSKRLIVFPTCLRLSKHDQKQTVLHEIAHALTAPHCTGEDSHGATWLQQCGLIMPLRMYVVESFIYWSRSAVPKSPSKLPERDDT
jgi:hypothetical protein